MRVYLLLFFWLNLFPFLNVFGSDQIERRPIYAGVFVNDISEIDPKLGSGILNFDMWLKWEGDSIDCPELIVQNIYDEQIEFAGYEHDNSTNWNIKRFNVRGKLYFKWDMLFFPFDHHKVHINLIINDQAYDAWELMPALSNSGLASTHTVTDWDVFPALMVSNDSITNKNITLNEAKPLLKKEIVSFYVEIKRPILPQFTKVIGPLILITLLGLLALALPIKELEVRAAFAFTALLSIVAYQFATGEVAPDVSYLTIIDKIFILGYFFVGASLFIIWYCTQLSQKKAARLSKRTFWILLPLFLVLNSYTIIAKYQEAVNPYPSISKQENKQEPIIKKDTLLIHVFRVQNLMRLKNLWLPDIEKSWGNYDVNELIPKYPSMGNNTIRLLTNGNMEVFWQIYDNLSWSDGTSLTVNDIAFGFKIEPDSLIKNIEVLNDDLVKITYGTKIFKPHHRNIPIYPKHFYQSMFDKFGPDSVINHRKNYIAPGYGAYMVSEINATGIAFRKNPYFANYSSQFECIYLKLSPYDSIHLLQNNLGDYILKNTLDPLLYKTITQQMPKAYEASLTDGNGNNCIVNSYPVTNSNYAILANIISKSFIRERLIKTFYGTNQLANAAYWPLSKKSQLFDSTCKHCDEFELKEIKELFVKNGFKYENQNLFNKEGKRVEINFFRLNQNQTNKAIQMANNFFISSFEKLGILVKKIDVQNQLNRFHELTIHPGFNVFLEPKMDEILLTNWTTYLRVNDSVLNDLFNRFNKEMINSLHLKLGKQMINYQTTHTHFFIPLSTMVNRVIIKKELKDYQVIPQSTLQNLHNYTEY